MFKSSNTKEMAKMSESQTPEKLNRIVSGTSIEGEIKTDSNIRIDGTVKGTITAKGRLVVGSSGIIDGEVVCENADIEGKITGQISVNGLLSLKSTARLECDITTKKLAIEPGAVFTGSCTMGGGVIKEFKNTPSEPQSQTRQEESKQGRG
ncbi:polymer-forming cytoskeletal protein [Cryomorphaceae bacterium 1068]|nr:polymer-forming cytoskeletal protein [Cryomorphaceae bacterium 1068]